MAKTPSGDKAGRGATAKAVRPAKARVRKAPASDGQAIGELGGMAEGGAKARKPRTRPVVTPQTKVATKRTPRAKLPASSTDAGEARLIAGAAPLVDTPPVQAPPSAVEPAKGTAATAPAPHDEELPHGLSPVDLPAPDGGEQPGLGWMTQVLLLSSVLLVLFNSFAIDKWARALPVNSYSGQIIDAADRWHGLMDRVDFNLPLETGRAAWHWVKALQWPGTPDQAEQPDAVRSDLAR